MAEELWQAYTEQGEPIKDPLTKDQAHIGALHGASHLWIWYSTGKSQEILVQQRSSSTRTWPGYYDISTAGHINYGERPLQAVLRQASEELGLKLRAEDLKLLFVYRQYLTHPASGIIENEFQWVYGYFVPKQFKPTFAKGEVKTTAWINPENFKKLIAGNGHMLMVPHGKTYFDNLSRGMANYRQYE